MAYQEGGIVHRYPGQQKPCVEVRVVKIFPDSRCLLEDGSMINRFTKTAYHAVEQCPAAKREALQLKNAIVVNFPKAVETRRNLSKSSPSKEPYITQRFLDNKFTCNCPWMTYHPLDKCGHIKSWERELGLRTD